MKGLEYRGLTRVEGPIVIHERPEDVGLGEEVELRVRPGVVVRGAAAGTAVATGPA